MSIETNIINALNGMVKRPGTYARNAEALESVGWVLMVALLCHDGKHPVRISSEKFKKEHKLASCWGVAANVVDKARRRGILDTHEQESLALQSVIDWIRYVMKDNNRPLDE